MKITSDDRVRATSPWFASVRLNPEAKLRMFCFPYAGGGASVFHSWANILPQGIDIYPIQYPGREHRLNEPPSTRLFDLVWPIQQAMLPHLDKPFVFYGHSMGGLIGFELIRLLRREGLPQPLHFFVSGCRGPHMRDRERITYNLPEDEFLNELRTLNGTPEEVLTNPELMQVLMPILRADFEVVDTYEYTTEGPLGMPISALGGLEDKKVETHHLKAWGEQTTAACTVHMFPGNHFFLRTAQPNLLRIVGRELLILSAAIEQGNRP